MEQMYEAEDQVPHECENCYWWAFDDWYPGERICVCPYSIYCGEHREADDTCDHWKEER